MREWQIKYYTLKKQRTEQNGPRIDQAAVIVAVSPWYQYEFSGDRPTLSLACSEEIHHQGIIKKSVSYRPTIIAGSPLAALSKVPRTTQLHILSGYGATGPHFAIVHALQATQPKTEDYLTLEQVLSKGREDASRAERDFLKREEKNINIAFQPHKTSNKQKNMHLTSKIEFMSEFQKIRTLVYKHYQQNSLYQKKMTQFAEEASKRLFSNFLEQGQKRFHCCVKKPDEGVFQIPELLIELMLRHAIDEMAHAVFLGPLHGIHYLLHLGASGRKSLTDKNIRELLTLTMEKFTGPEKPHQMGWVRFGFNPILDCSRSSSEDKMGRTPPSTASDKTIIDTLSEPSSPSSDDLLDDLYEAYSPNPKAVHFVTTTLFEAMVKNPAGFSEEQRNQFCELVRPVIKSQVRRQQTTPPIPIPSRRGGATCRASAKDNIYVGGVFRTQAPVASVELSKSAIGPSPSKNGTT